MQHRTYRLISFIVAVALALGTFISAGARGGTQSPSMVAGRTFFVSNSGSDTNPGTSSAPFRTFSKAMSMLAPGDELQIFGGTYTQQLSVTKSGTSSAPISIKAVPGQQVILDGGGSRDELILVPDATSYVNVSDITCKRASVSCVVLRGTRIKVSNLDVSEGKKFGIRVTGSYVTVENSRVHDNVTENLNGTNTTGGWGSALRSAQGSGSNNIFRFNEVFHNWGEGIIMGSNNSQVYGNHVYDNYSKNIYIGNTYSVDVYQNLTHSTDSRWFRSGNPADCISLSEELITDTYGAKLGNIRVFNNIASNCKSGIGYTYAEVTGNGCDNCLFAFNTITSARSICIKVIDGSKNHIQIADNICTSGSISFPSGDISVSNNFMGDARLTGGAISDANSYRPLSNSPVIGAGINVGISTDYFGVSRSRYDIGSIQAGSSTVQPTATVPSPTAILPTATQVPTLAPPSPTAPASITPTSPPSSTSWQTYDDKSGAFVYTGTWEDVAASGAYNGSFKKSVAPGQSVSMTFSGRSFSVIYTANSTFTRMDVKVDGVLVGTINEYAASRELQKKWDLPITLASGVHTLTLIHQGTDTTTKVTLDGVMVNSSSTAPTPVPPSPTTVLPTATTVPTLAPPSPTAPAPVTPTSQPPSVGAQTYDDKNSIFVYSGTWDDMATSGSYSDSFKKSMAPGQSVSMTFTGSSFSVIYTANSTFTNMQLFVDGVQVGTINEYAASRQLQKVWDLPIVLATGTHTLKLVHAGTDTTTRVSLDAVKVYP